MVFIYNWLHGAERKSIIELDSSTHVEKLFIHIYSKLQMGFLFFEIISILKKKIETSIPFKYISPEEIQIKNTTIKTNSPGAFEPSSRIKSIKINFKKDYRDRIRYFWFNVKRCFIPQRIKPKQQIAYPFSRRSLDIYKSR